ncbi:hypothetical protein AK830_g170 [Neonectria ditissima]|uniref:DUF1446 domain-containing protein n=1 Tax=Neonectria ditissima TaxID=78410 RepID=A0A0P7C3U6_9HYPO|nr:hypothetical protein AK830_g170 [Neonectria ditissima]
MTTAAIPRRAIRIGNCAGAACDAGYQMLQANLAQNSTSFREGSHPGYEPNALQGLQLSLKLAAEKGIKLIVNGGALNPEGLARAVADSVRDPGLEKSATSEWQAKEQGVCVKIGWTSGDDVLPTVHQSLQTGEGLVHLDGDNRGSFLVSEIVAFIESPQDFDIVTAHAYTGARAIRMALEAGCGIVICGRVADASPVVGAAAWWHGWDDSDFDQLAGSLVAGHLIECSGYGTGGNFCEFFQFPRHHLVDIGFPIAEISSDGSSVITKHPNTRGFVTTDILKAQLLYEIQGTVYLNSDCKADLSEVQISQQGQDRVKITGTKGLPPPPTTKLAIFYKGGWQCEYTLNATGYAVAEKFRLHETQIRFRLEAEGVIDDFQVLEFQVYGSPRTDPKSQLESTSSIRVFGQARFKKTVEALKRAMLEGMLQHYAGMHGTLDWRLLEPKPYLSYCPCLIPQTKLREAVHMMDFNGAVTSFEVSPLKAFEELGARVDQQSGPLDSPDKFRPTTKARLGDVVLARSGDKGGNLNVGFFVRSEDEWQWLRGFMDHERMKILMASEWRNEFKLERCELTGIHAVHFVIYGILSKGVSSSARLDALGKGFAEFVRDRWVDLPSQFVQRYYHSRPPSHRGNGDSW